MKIFFDITSMMRSDLTGVGVYEREVLLQLQKISLDISDTKITPVYKLSRFKKLNYLNQHLSQHILDSIKPFHVINDIFSSANDVFHGPDCKMISKGQQKKIVTIHDLQTFFEEFWIPTTYQFAVKKAVNKFTNLVHSNLDHIIVVSHSVEQDLRKHFPTLNVPITVIYHGTEHMLSPNQDDQTNKINQLINEKLKPLDKKKFVFCLGTIELRKNQGRLIDAFSELQNNEERDLILVLAGENGHGAEYMMKQYSAAIDKLKSQKRFLMLGSVDHTEKQWLIANCSAFAYPSLYEGFGIPLIEAMIYSKPILTSNFGAMNEVVGPQGICVNTRDVKSIINGLRLALKTEYAKIDWSQRLKLFSWKNSAKKHLQVYLNNIDGY